MMIYLLIIWTTAGPIKVGDTRNSEICSLWDQYTQHTQCIIQSDI